MGRSSRSTSESRRASPCFVPHLVKSGMCLVTIKLLERIEAALREALRLNYPDRVEAWNNLGYVLTAQKKYQDAEDVLRRAILIAPTRPQLWRNLRRALIGQNWIAEAEEAEKTRLRLFAGAQPPPSEPAKSYRTPTADF